MSHAPLRPAAPAAESLSVSVAMGTYNGEKYIREQLDSLASQSRLPLELVITDDGSTDATLDIVEAFRQTAPFIVRVYRNESRLGFADNFLKAAALCRGDLIAFCDQDDIWMADKLRICTASFADPEVLLVIHSAQTLWGDGRRGRFYPEFTRTRVLPFGSCDPISSVPGFAMMTRSELLKMADSRGCRPAKVYNHDLWAWFLAASAGRIVTLADVLALYRQHESNAFGARRKRTMLQSLQDGARIFDYGDVADYELACAQILSRAGDTSPERWRQSLKTSARRMVSRSRLHRIRARLYNPSSGALVKLKTFVTLMFLGAYLPDRARYRLGMLAAIKDLFIAIGRFPPTTAAPAPLELQRRQQPAE